jgi:hypothetical protein
LPSFAVLMSRALRARHVGDLRVDIGDLGPILCFDRRLALDLQHVLKVLVARVDDLQLDRERLPRGARDRLLIFELVVLELVFLIERLPASSSCWRMNF